MQRVEAVVAASVASGAAASAVLAAAYGNPHLEHISLGLNRRDSQWFVNERVYPP